MRGWGRWSLCICFVGLQLSDAADMAGTADVAGCTADITQPAVCTGPVRRAASCRAAARRLQSTWAKGE
jgi:hypothetical protein